MVKLEQQVETKTHEEDEEVTFKMCVRSGSKREGSSSVVPVVLTQGLARFLLTQARQALSLRQGRQGVERARDR